MKKPKFYVISGILWNLKDISSNMIEKALDTELLFVEHISEIKMIFDLLKIDYKGKIIELKWEDYHKEISEESKKIISDTFEQWGNIGLFEIGWTACFMDPWYMLLKYIHLFKRIWNIDFSIIPIPWMSAITTAISVSGFFLDKFIFDGFLSWKSGNFVLNSNLPVIYFVEMMRDSSEIQRDLAFMQGIFHKNTFVWINIWKSFGKWFEEQENILIHWSYDEVYKKLMNFYDTVVNKQSDFRWGYQYVIIFNTEEIERF